MVLINNLTIDEINAALLHLQRSQGEIVGGNKGNTINNISVTQQGGGGYSPDFSSAIKNLEKRVDTLDVKTEQNQQNIAGQSKINVTQKDQISDLYNLVNNLRSSQITELFFDEDTRVLTLATTDARYDVPLPSEEVSLTFDSTSNKLVFSMGEQTKEVTLPYINASEKGVANGVATLDDTGRVPYSQLPESAMELKGEWNADTNTPTLKDGHGTNGDFYICNVGGTANFGTSENPRTITFYVNDRVIYQGNVAQWKRLPASEVRTVNGQSGDVTLNGTNVKYSDANNSPTLKDKIDTVEGYAKTQSDWGQTNTSAIDYIKNKPNLATVATSGSYDDLSNKPTIPDAQIQSDWTQTNSSSKDFIKNKIPIWITSGSADDNMSPIDSVTDGSMRPITSNAVADIMSSLPTDAVLHYSFDDVPDYPDGSAILYRNHNFTTDFAGFDTNNFGTLSVENGELVDTVTNRTYTWIRRYFSSAVEGIVKLKIRANKTCSFYLQYYNGSTYTTITSITNANPNQNYIIIAYVPSTQFINIQPVVSTSQDFQVVLSEFYIGNGSYNTPVIDNANGQNNAINNGGIAVQGVSGKGVELLSGKDVRINNFNLNTDFTVSLWVRPEEVSNTIGIVISKEEQLILYNGANWQGGYNTVHLYVYSDLSNNYTYFGNLLELNKWTHIVIIKSSNIVKVYKNGILSHTKTLDSATLRTNNNPFMLGRNTTNKKQSLDDFQIFNRAISEQEVQALYLNKANTPKYYSWADWKLSQIS